LGCCIDVDIVDACAMLGDNAQRFPCCDSTGTKLPHSRHDPNRVVLFEEVSEYLLRWIGGCVNKGIASVFGHLLCSGGKVGACY